MGNSMGNREKPEERSPKREARLVSPDDGVAFLERFFSRAVKPS
jgi:hypothetical protein